jgi:hypothetical protein
MLSLADIKKLTPADGDVFCLPADASAETAEDFAEALQLARPGIKALVFRGPIEHLNEAAMNRAGWQRMPGAQGETHEQ